MARGMGWWGTAPLVVGAGGLLLLAFGAKELPGSDELNDEARRRAEELVAGVRAGDPLARREAAEILHKAGKTPDVPDGQEPEDPAARVRDALYEVLSDHRDPGTVLAGRIAFYGGLVLLFAAGVLLYRRTPESNQRAW